jgi:hypothetical protein
MGSKPKIPDPVPPPAPPPPPEPVAERVDNDALKKRAQAKKSGASSLTVRRPTVNTGSSGTGANINY